MLSNAYSVRATRYVNCGTMILQVLRSLLGGLQDIMLAQTGEKSEYGYYHCVLNISCVVSKHYWLRPDMASSGFCLLNTVGVAAV